MQFSDTTNKSGLIQFCEKKCGFDDAGISGNATKLAQFTSAINRAYGLAINWIFAVDGKWHFDDRNYTDFPIATTTLVANQRDYSLPDSLLHLRQVEIMRTDGKYTTLTLMNDDDYRLREQNQQEDASLPSHYYLRGNSIFIYPKTTSDYVTLAAGLRVTFDRYVDYFTVADTTQTPGFAEPFHQIIGYLASAEYLGDKALFDRKSDCEQEIYGNAIKRGLKYELERYYRSRNVDDKATIRPSVNRAMFR